MMEIPPNEEARKRDLHISHSSNGPTANFRPKREHGAGDCLDDPNGLRVMDWVYALANMTNDYRKTDPVICVGSLTYACTFGAAGTESLPSQEV
jgi:hypothetical protein